MNSILNKTRAPQVLALSLCAAIVLGLAPPLAHAAPAQGDAQLQQQLDDARSRLDDAARDVAEL
ncbi:MAG: hypothetical protein OEX15_10365, partial [Gammaproteobacteria bacterium]|nr:hypothetical protein [Gammaproteobacteria bacterium]